MFSGVRADTSDIDEMATTDVILVKGWREDFSDYVSHRVMEKVQTFLNTPEVFSEVVVLFN